MQKLPDGWVIVCKQDCPTCILVVPVLQQMAAAGTPLTVYTQDDPTFPPDLANVIDDTDLEQSYRLQIETVPTLLHVVDGAEVERLEGWNRAAWQTLTGLTDLGADLPEYMPGCGSLSVEPGMAERLALRFDDSPLQARRIELASLEDEIEACYSRGWSDGLPVVPPTPERVLRMLSGTRRAADEVIGLIPPNQAECTVEKAAINAVMAGCKPEYLPVVLTAVEAACLDKFCMHGVLATTYFSGPVVIVSGPLAEAIGMNAGTNALGQGNRANATIGRALQLIIRNVGGGKPGGVDRAALGNPGKYTFCFAENTHGSSWESLSTERGFGPQASTVTLFAGDGVQGISDQLSRRPESLARSFAASLRSVGHPKLVMAADALLVVSPEHSRVFERAGWSKERLYRELDDLLQIPRAELLRDAGSISAGIPDSVTRDPLPKFRPGGLTIVRAGGTAGLFSAIIGGWVGSGPKGSQPVTMEIKEINR